MKVVSEEGSKQTIETGLRGRMCGAWESRNEAQDTDDWYRQSLQPHIEVVEFH
jgi:hypothetical protein